MSLFMPFDSLTFVFDLFSFLVIDTNHIIFSGCGEGSSAGVVIKGHDVVSLFKVMPDLLPCFGCELVEVTVGIGN